MQTNLMYMEKLLQALEHALRGVDWWGKNPPSAEALASQEPFCIDTLRFTEWLQWVYIPKMQTFIHKHQALPSASSLLSIAEEAWKGCMEDTQSLLDVIEALDAVVNFGQVNATLWGEIEKRYF